MIGAGPLRVALATVLRFVGERVAARIIERVEQRNARQQNSDHIGRTLWLRRQLGIGGQFYADVLARDAIGIAVELVRRIVARNRKMPVG